MFLLCVFSVWPFRFSFVVFLIPFVCLANDLGLVSGPFKAWREEDGAGYQFPFSRAYT